MNEIFKRLSGGKTTPRVFKPASLSPVISFMSLRNVPESIKKVIIIASAKHLNERGANNVHSNSVKAGIEIRYVVTSVI